MQSNRPHRSTVPALALAAGALLLGTACESPGPEVSASCGNPRVVVFDGSSQNRGPDSVASAEELLTAQLLGAAVCHDPLMAISVVGGSEQKLFDAGSPVASEIAVGPNERARAKTARKLQGEARTFVNGALAGVLEEDGGASVTSVSALYGAAAQHAAPSSRVLLLTTGVEIDGDVDLNRPLAKGEGRSFAAGVEVPTLPEHSTVTVVGLGRMDSHVPEPGAAWPAEVREFNEALCEASGASCTLFSVATVAESNP